MISLDVEILKLFKNKIIPSILIKYAENIFTSIL